MMNAVYRVMAIASVFALGVTAAACSHFKHEASPASEPAASDEAQAPSADAEKQKMDQPTTTPQLQ